MSVSASSRRPLVISLLCVGIVDIAVASWFSFRSRPEAPLAAIDAPAARQSSREDVAADPQYVMVGGVRRKVTDVRPNASEPKLSESDGPRDYGLSPPVKANANPQVASVAEAMQEKNHPERLSVMMAPKPFDAEAFRANPQDYLDTIEPGRVFQTAQPGPGVPRLRSLSPYFQRVVQGDAVTLAVYAPPGSPVCFASIDLGQFTSSQLTATTVQADDQGVAKAEFQATPGTINDVNILAGSPEASGQVKFVVHVELAAASEVE